MPRKCIDPSDVGGICPKGFVHTPVRALLPTGGEFTTDLCCPPEKGDPSVFCTRIGKKDTCPRGETKTVIVRLWPDGDSDKQFHCCPDSSFDYFRADEEAQVAREEDGEGALEEDDVAVQGSFEDSARAGCEADAFDVSTGEELTGASFGEHSADSEWNEL